jgi:hypothetical protein
MGKPSFSRPAVVVRRPCRVEGLALASLPFALSIPSPYSRPTLPEIGILLPGRFPAYALIPRVRLPVVMLVEVQLVGYAPRKGSARPAMAWSGTNQKPAVHALRDDLHRTPSSPGSGPSASPHLRARDSSQYRTPPPKAARAPHSRAPSERHGRRDRASDGHACCSITRPGCHPETPHRGDHAARRGAGVCRNHIVRRPS